MAILDMSGVPDLSSVLLTTPCAWCFDPSAETIALVIGDDGPEIELDLCARHVSELLQGSRPMS